MRTPGARNPPKVTALSLRRIGLVVHPDRPLQGALERAHAWAAAHESELVQVHIGGQTRVVARSGDAASCDIVVALGGDGTTLAALHAAAPAGRPVLGVACGSLGVLTAVAAEAVDEALTAVASGAWKPRDLPGLALSDGEPAPLALNDVVVLRDGSSQVVVAIHLDGELYARIAGDGVVVATPLGSGAYTLAAGGPLLAPGTTGMVLTPLAPHGGRCPPLVAGPQSRITLDVEPGHGGARLEVDGQVRPLGSASLQLTCRSQAATLIELGGPQPVLGGLRQRGIVTDSPRVLARDAREAAGR